VTERPRIVSLLKPSHALGRLVTALAVGITAGMLLVLRYSAVVAAVGGWNVAALLLLAYAWKTIHTADAAVTRQKAAAEDPGRTAIYALTLFTSAASLFAATVLVGGAKSISSRDARELIALCLLTTAVSWTLTHTAFALRYAHLYYREDVEGVGGVDFAGCAAPRYFDFAYLAFTVGMTFQVSDVAVTSPQVRRAVLLQAVISFAYNTAILAFILNLTFGFAS
jgi:uncharacterized membrane protein